MLRYYKNNFSDGYRQVRACIELFVNKIFLACLLNFDNVKFTNLFF